MKLLIFLILTNTHGQARGFPRHRFYDIKGIHLNGISKSLYKPFETSDELKEVYMCDDFDVTIDKNVNVLANCQCFSNIITI